MRRALASVLALFAALTLSACVMGSDGAAEDGPAVEAAEATLSEATLEAAAIEAVPEPEIAPDITQEPTIEPAPQPAAPEPPIQARARAECTEGGGIFARRDSGLYACVHPTRDAGRQCRSSADCQGGCLARSGTCAPFVPLFGCTEMLTAPGRRETVCLE